MKSIVRRIAALALAAALLLSLSGIPGAAAEGRSPRLVKTVTEYEIDYQTQEWEPVRVWEYAYENGYPVSVDVYEDGGDFHHGQRFRYRFEDGVPAERTDFDLDGSVISTVEYNRGRVYNIFTESDGGQYRKACYFQYANGDEYFTLVLHESVLLSSEPGMTDDRAEEVDAVSVTTRDGLLSRTVNTGLYANWNDDEEKQWLRFSGTYTAEYDDSGILCLLSSEHRIGPSGVTDRFELTTEDGLVTEAIRLFAGSEGFSPAAKFVFEYTEEDISAGRYAMMINAFLAGEQNMYYYYFWY